MEEYTMEAEAIREKIRDNFNGIMVILNNGNLYY